MTQTLLVCLIIPGEFLSSLAACGAPAAPLALTPLDRDQPRHFY